MKFIICLATLLMAANAIAKAPPVAINPLPKAPVFRTGTIKVSIVKSELVKHGDHYERIVEKVCTKNAPIKVWDLRDSGTFDSVIISCSTTYENKKTTATVDVTGMIADWAIHDDPPPYQTVFSFVGGLSLSDLQDPTQLKNYSFSTQTRDIYTNSLINSVGPIPRSECQQDKCTISNVNLSSETITATVEFIGQ